MSQVQPAQGHHAADQDPDRDIPVDVVTQIVGQDRFDLVVTEFFDQCIAEDNSLF